MFGSCRRQQLLVNIACPAFASEPSYLPLQPHVSKWTLNDGSAPTVELVFLVKETFEHISG